MKKVIVSGNQACANIAYMFNDVAVVYPITPSSPVAESCEEWSVKGKENIFSNTLKLIQMQSEAGVAGAVHGGLMAGAKTTTFTSSQGLLLMIPNMYKIAGEGLPCVFYVASRSVATHALNIFCDHSDVYACMKTGFNIVNCSSVQEVNDLAIACELATVKSNIPYLCFFDGFRTSHELNTICQTEKEDILKVVDKEFFNSFKNRGMDVSNPKCYGTNQNPDVFMQNRVMSANKYQKVIEDFVWALEKQKQITGREYSTIDYYGNKKAKHVVVCIGSGCEVLNVANKTVNEEYGIIKVRMLKPFDEKRFIEILPKGVKSVTVLERNLEPNGEDVLTQTVISTLFKNKIKVQVMCGCYGLGGKELTPSMALSVFENAKNRKMKKFTIGVNDDVSNSNIPHKEQVVNENVDYTLRVYGLGSDGSVSSVKNALKILGEHGNNFVQGYFDYDSKKSGSLTISHMRISKNKIEMPYNPTQVDYVMCNNEGFLKKYEVAECLKENGVLIINTSYNEEQLNEIMLNSTKCEILKKNIKVYTIDADEIAHRFELRGKINNIMLMALFKVSNLMPLNEAKEKIKELIKTSYVRSGEKTISANLKAVDFVDNQIKQIGNECFNCGSVQQERKFANEIIAKTSLLKGNELPVSMFSENGEMPTATSKFEKRAIAQVLPDWNSEKCIQCGRCVMMCPHAAIRSKIVDGQTKGVKSAKAFGKNGNYCLQVCAMDCTGCGVCASVCPTNALTMVESEKINVELQESEEKFFKINSTETGDYDCVKNLQFKQPYFEFSGACAGCGETPYIKLASQLFGDRMVIANATGCSSIYGGTYPTCPYTTDENGFGPTWANSLFEDNAEFGYGIAVARRNQRKNFINLIKNLKFSAKISKFVEILIKNPENHENNKNLILELKNLKTKNKFKFDDEYLFKNINLITSPSFWIVGGDGWAYDIGFGGLDHVVASGENVNILILDTEVYSNTGGQCSKATPRGAIAKLNSTGKQTMKKDLASMLMTYKNVYVASVSMNANPEQCLRAFVEAENFNGPSVIIAYSPCANHGYDMKNSQIHAMNSVRSGNTTLFRFNPDSEEQMKIDSFEPTMQHNEFVLSENRFALLKNVNPKNKKELIEKNRQDAILRRVEYKNKTKLK